MSLLNALYLLLPAAVANMAPVIFARIPFLAAPVDFNFMIGARRLFGANKTWRGLASGILAGAITAVIQNQFFNIDFFANPAIFGALLGLSALLGDLLSSAIKRRLNIAPGQAFYIIDQINWVVPALIVLRGVGHPITLTISLLTILIFGLLHVVINQVAFRLNVRSNPW
ncbi:MAG: hypothetical protein COU10_03610 [Candidatus Harrisonbacteria bacterium CG10_big_fil_rev_8_21_14_0_10_45_28]|uniref:CDP-2,3-bis-(O-geranylgeranyl)-sn-glycerol synthase n=1 Tax=Candidatus Harrisonbacteria bacterium CG10_big_fil_rev_8_21_14_0_10_45_28 TaxID=1974586 RepID=A0A2H0UMI4_9BACT|nr:MAG: hypothetical protein COU10_03610 [Candidatus Harrisonbacteria bacterium CG10_big_fil_rev_8_21_14_0_10_45_28]